MVDTCAECGSENIQAGYGMAYGGMGVYFYCADCEALQSKHQDPETELEPCLDCLDAPPSKYGRLCDNHYEQRKSQLDEGGDT